METERRGERAGDTPGSGLSPVQRPGRAEGRRRRCPSPGQGSHRRSSSSSRAAPDGGWLSADESSGYESESAGGERAGAAAAGGSRGRQRRARTAFTSEQVCRLEKTFQRQKYLGATERRKLAAALQLSEIQVSPAGSGSFAAPFGRSSQGRRFHICLI
ncbi:hypothetical protein DV515_00005925 [Chloebia gouldiae]|uniref:Homeobox domain-containing protein n=1 Tax=Chloebia gouldiae TaxID=44316 RepID=A0A3L8SLB7_CHLGU|nr:hypothetical protein DV515_00005925 [Chloebia gouldiae]